MLDETSGALLAKLNALCEGGGFKIIESAELCRMLPVEETELSRRMAYLAEKRLIELRYAEEGMYCVRTLPAGRVYAEAAAREARESLKNRRTLFFGAALGAFLGGSLAGIVVSLITLLV